MDTADPAIAFSVKVSYVEIYEERIRDLLDPTAVDLRLHEDPSPRSFLSVT
jgi:hypothetical protein